MDETLTTPEAKSQFAVILERLKAYLSLSNFFSKKKLLLITLIYLLVLIFWHWGLQPSLGIIFFLAGGLVGIHFLDFADALFALSPSPFKNVLFQSIFVPFTLFVLTSSGSLFGAGLVLSIFLSMIYSQWLTSRQNGNLNSWFGVIKREIIVKNQQIYLWVMSGLFIFLSLLF